MSDNVWTSEYTTVERGRYFWWRSESFPEHRWTSEFRQTAGEVHSTLPIPSAERHHALEELAKAAKDAPDWLCMNGCAVEERAIGDRIAAALARLEETT